jgi:predicted nucleic acid-binding protein
MKFLDTDVMIDVLRGHPPALAWLKALGNEEVGLCGLL